MRRILSVLAICIFAVSSHAAESTKTLRVGVFTWAGNGLLHVAKEKKFFGDMDIEIKIIDDIPTLINAYRSGQIDVMNNTLDGAALLAGNGTEAKIIYATDNSFGADGIVASSDIKTVKDLKGKKVGFVQGIFQHFFLNQLLKQNGMTIEDIKPVAFNDPSLPAQSVFSGKVDAAVSWEPYLSQATKNGFQVVASSKTYPGTYLNDYFASDKTLADKSAEIKTLIAGLIKAADYVGKNKDETAGIIAKGFGMKKQEVLDTMQVIYYLTPAQNAEYLCGENPKAAATYNEAAEFWTQQKLSKTKPSDGKNHIATIGCDLFSAK